MSIVLGFQIQTPIAPIACPRKKKQEKQYQVLFTLLWEPPPQGVVCMRVVFVDFSASQKIGKIGTKWESRIAVSEKFVQTLF